MSGPAMESGKPSKVVELRLVHKKKCLGLPKSVKAVNCHKVDILKYNPLSLKKIKAQVFGPSIYPDMPTFEMIYLEGD